MILIGTLCDLTSLPSLLLFPPLSSLIVPCAALRRPTSRTITADYSGQIWPRKFSNYSTLMSPHLPSHQSSYMRCATSLLLVIALLLPVVLSAAPRRPDIIFILTDDQVPPTSYLITSLLLLDVIVVSTYN